MTKKLVYIELKKITEKELSKMMSSRFNRLTQRGLDRELEHLTTISYRTWGNYKLDGKLKRGVVRELRTVKANQLLFQVASSPQKIDDSPHARVNIEIIDEIKEFLRIDDNANKKAIKKENNNE